MTMKLLDKDTIVITEYSIRDFVFSCAKASKAGYSPVDTNAGYPQGYVNFYTCQMKLDSGLTPEQRKAMGLEEINVTESVVENTTEETNTPEITGDVEVTTPTKRKRK